LRYPVVDRVADQLTEGFTAERGIAPNDALTFGAGRDEVEGRKRWVTGRLGPPDGDIATRAEGLFLHLLARSGLTWPTCGGGA
jgi:hypothetical protein